METLDHQNLVLTGQSEEIALLRSKMRNFESLIDAFRNRQSLSFFDRLFGDGGSFR